MADATRTRSFQAENLSTSPVATYPLAPSGKPFVAPKGPASAYEGLDTGKAHAIAQAKRRQWAALNLRQEWADEAFMRGHLRVAGLRVKYSTEPATVNRMKERLRSIGVHSPEIQEAIGMPLGRWLMVNPRLPLWAALALVLESIGRFTPDAAPTAETMPVVQLEMPSTRLPFTVTAGGQE